MQEILELNKKGVVPDSLEILVMPEVILAQERKEASSLSTDLESLDRKYSEATQKKKKKKSRNNRSKNRTQPPKAEKP